MKPAEWPSRSCSQPQGTSTLSSQLGVGTWGSKYCPKLRRGTRVPSPSQEPLFTATALNLLAISLPVQGPSVADLQYLQRILLDLATSVSVSRPETKLRVAQGIILATSKPRLLLLEQCLTHNTGLVEPFVFPFLLWPEPLAGRVLGLRPAIELGWLCASPRLSGGQCICPGLCLCLQSFLACTDNMGLPPTPSCN